MFYGGAYATIKDLKDLSFLSVGVTIDMQVLTDLKRCFSREHSRGTGPRATVKKSVPFTVGRGPVPRRASVEETALASVRFLRGSSDRGGQAPALRFSRPPPFHRRARACPSPCLDRHGKRRWLAFGFRVGRTIAGDRPPRYGR